MLFDLTNNNLNIIEIWIEQRGRKSDTYVYGWNINDDELKNHLKIIKKKKGCNGSIKEITRESNPIKVMQLQGNVKDFIISYLRDNGVDNDDIKVKI